MKITDLTLDHENARKRDGKASAKLAESLIQFGAARSVVIDGDGIVRAGNGTVEAAKAAGISKVKVIKGKPDELVVVQREDLEGEKAKAYAIADNRTGELAEWDLDELQLQLEGFEDFTADDLGFDADDLKDLFPEEPVEPEDVPPQIDRADELAKEWGTKEKQLWTIEGQQTHRLCCGDSTKAEDVERLMGDTTPSLLVADPPYGMSLETKRRHGDSSADFVREKRDYEPIIGDDVEFVRSSVCIEGNEEYWFGADYYVETLPGFGKGGSWLVWNKRAEGGNEKMHGSMFELIWSKQKHRREILHCVWNGVLGHVRKTDGPQKVHPTQKPARLLSVLIERASTSGQLVVDPFLGSGTTMLAAEQLNRRCFGMEISPNYVAVILQRMTDAGCECKLAKA